ncbi:phage portal protein [Streptomyces europaeiscabiei]|uniref:phage portal protein n=1 Tax=Streptomyces europaeiscabiei TaxID=146819 RepID=UPI0029B637D6|nr:phage portal protein [Streptomyces europaeiscabiei]MDX2528047.1 phage portal protein [Streptomyces europaeiscabiei]
MLDDTPGTPDWWLLRLGRRMRDRGKDLDRWWDYYSGKHPLPSLPKNAAAAFLEFQRKSRTNFCRPVADAPVHRLQVLGVTDADGRADDDALRWWQANKLDSRQKLLYRTVMAQAQAYVIVGPHPARVEPDEETPSPLVTAEHPRQVIVERDPATGERAAAVKAWWDDVYRVGRATVYLPHGLQRYVTPQRRGPGQLPWGQESWDPDGGFQEHDLGAVPVVPFECRPDLMESPVPEFAGVLDIQDRINMGVLNRMTAARYSAFRQGFVTGHKFRKRSDPATGLEVVEQPFVPSPSALWASEGENVKFGQLDATDLSGFLKEHESDVRDMLVLSHTPAYYFASDLVNISADTVNALDVNHLAKVGEHQATFGESWEDVLSLCARQAGVERDYAQSEVRWADPRRLNPSVIADAATKKHAVGYPLAILAEDMGESPQRIRRITSEAAGAALLASTVLPAPAAQAPAQQAAPDRTGL